MGFFTLFLLYILTGTFCCVHIEFAIATSPIHLLTFLQSKFSFLCLFSAPPCPRFAITPNLTSCPYTHNTLSTSDLQIFFFIPSSLTNLPKFIPPRDNLQFPVETFFFKQICSLVVHHFCTQAVAS